MNTTVNVTSKEVQLAAQRRQASVQRYRARNRRIDYVPSAKALAAIAAGRALKLDPTLAGTIDRLVTAGLDALSGKIGTA
jgi:hypothetical protein